MLAQEIACCLCDGLHTILPVHRVDLPEEWPGWLCRRCEQDWLHILTHAYWKKEALEGTSRYLPLPTSWEVRRWDDETPARRNP